jgi:putative transposase
MKPLPGRLRAMIAGRISRPLAGSLAGLVLSVAGSTGFVVHLRCWTVERSRGWCGRWGRLSKDQEAPPEIIEAIVTLDAIRLTPHGRAHPKPRRLPAA